MENKIQIAEPSLPFKPFIRYYKYIETDLTGIFKVIPIPFVELYFNFTHIDLFSPGKYDLHYPLVHLAGIHQFDQNTYSHMHGNDKKGGFAIVFQPQGFNHLFKVKSSEFCTYSTNFESIFKKEFIQLWERLRALSDINEMKILVESFLSNNVNKAIYRVDLVNSIVSYMDKINGIISVSEICKKYNTTPRSLERYFRDEIGITPKELLQIFRINKAINLLNGTIHYDLTDISYLSGYFDQSHFIKDIKKITGFSPTNLQGIETIKETIHNRLFVKS